jgi:hypothetical protein
MSPVALAACGILEPDPTTVSGTVLENGVPVPGVVVELLVARDSYLRSLLVVAQDTTDAQGHYSVANSSEETSCFHVRVAMASRLALRLTTLPGPTIRHLSCGDFPVGAVDFHFTRNIWYGGIFAGPDSVTIDVGDQVSLQAEFSVTDRPAPGLVHRDSVQDWVWVGDEGWSWTGLETFLSPETDQRYCQEYCHPPPGLLTLRARGRGAAQLIATLTGSPFADTVTVVVN